MNRIKTESVAGKELAPIPAGVYKTEAISCHVVDTDASLELRITKGEFKGRKLFYWIKGNFLAEVDVVRMTTPDSITVIHNRVRGITSEVKK